MKHVIAFALLGLSCAAPKQQSEPIREERPSVEAAAIRPQKAASLSLLEAPARVLAAPTGSAVVSSLLETRVLRVRVSPGQTVAENEALLDVLMPDVLKAAGALSSASIRLSIYQTRREKLAALLEQGLARAAEVGDLDQNIALAKADQQAARATLRTASISDKQAESLLASDGTLTLRSPMAGVVTQVNVRPGEVRAPSSGSFVEIAADAATRVEARFTSLPPEGAKLEWLGSDGSAALEVDSYAPQAGAADGTRLVWLRVKDGHKPLVAGTLGRVRVIPRADWVLVPKSTLVSDGNQTRVNVRRGEKTVAVDVVVIMQGNQDVVVTGIDEADELIASSSHVTEDKP